MAEEIEKDAEGVEEAEEIIDPPAIDSKYRMIILAAQRSKQLEQLLTAVIGWQTMLQVTRFL